MSPSCFMLNVWMIIIVWPRHMLARNKNALKLWFAHLQSEWALIREDPKVVYIHGVLNNLAVFSRVLCIHVIHLLIMSPMTSFQCAYFAILTASEDGLSSPLPHPPNYASFCVVKHMLRVFRGCRHWSLFETKCSQNTINTLKFLKTLVVCHLHMLLRPLVTPFPNLVLKDMVALKNTLNP